MNQTPWQLTTDNWIYSKLSHVCNQQSTSVSVSLILCRVVFALCFAFELTAIASSTIVNRHCLLLLLHSSGEGDARCEEREEHKLRRKKNYLKDCNTGNFFNFGCRHVVSCREFVVRMSWELSWGVVTVSWEMSWGVVTVSWVVVRMSWELSWGVVVSNIVLCNVVSLSWVCRENVVSWMTFNIALVWYCQLPTACHDTWPWHDYTQRPYSMTVLSGLIDGIVMHMKMKPSANKPTAKSPRIVIVLLICWHVFVFEALIARCEATSPSNQLLFHHRQTNFWTP